MLISCGQEPSPSPVPTVTPVPTVIPIPPGPTPSPSPSPTPSPEPEFYTGFIHGPEAGLVQGAPFLLADRVSQHPIEFSFASLGYTIPVRNQGKCGSCYLQGSVEAWEYALNIFVGPTPQLSTQQVLDCDNSYFHCNGGNFTESYMTKNPLGFESDYPYTAVAGRCKSVSNTVQLPLKAINVGTRGRAPSTEELKDAMMQWGPLAVTVAATSSWSSYKGGVKKSCGGTGINHITLIYGWTKDGWIMRNSWGTKWGQNGDAIMPYGCDRIADEAAVFLVKPLSEYKHPSYSAYYQP